MILQRLVPWLAMLGLAGLGAAAEAGQADTGRAALAAAVATRNVSLRRALFETVVYAAKGRPISAQYAAMAKAKTALADAVGRAETANKGFRTVSIVAALREGRPVAEVSLLKGQEWRTAVEGLD